MGSWIMSKEIQLPADSNDLPHLFWKVASSNGTYRHLYSVLVTDSADYTDTTNYALLYTDSSTHVMFSNYDLLGVDLTPYAGRNIHIAFRNHWNHLPSSSIGLYLDDVEIRSAAVPLLGNIQVAADIYTADSGNCAVAVLQEGNRNGLTYSWYSMLMDTTFVTTGDTLPLPYTFGGNDTLMLVAANAFGSDTAFATLKVHHCPVALQAPLEEPFEYDSDLDCWRRLNFYTGSNSNGGWMLTRDPWTAYNNIVFQANDNDSWLISPEIMMPSNGAGLNLHLKVEGHAYQANNTFLAIRVSPTGGADTADFSDMLLFRDLSFQWESISVPLSAYAGQQVRIAFVHTVDGTYQVGLFIDSLSIGYDSIPSAAIQHNDAFVGDTTVFTASVGNIVNAGLNYSWHSSMMDTTWGDTNVNPQLYTFRLVYDREGTDTVTFIVGNAYGADTVTSVVVVGSHPLPEVTISVPRLFFVGDSCHYYFTLNDCSRNGLTSLWHSSLLDSTLVDVSFFDVLYPVGGYDTITLIVANLYGADTAVVVVYVMNCTPATIPYYQDFEGVTATSYSVEGFLPDCWTFTHNGSNAAYTPHVITTSDYYYLSNIPNHALLIIAGSTWDYGTDEQVFLPRMNRPLSTLSLAFDYRFENQTQGTLTVGYYEGDSLFVPVDTIQPHGDNYLRDTVNFSSVSDNLAHIVFRWNHDQMYYGVAIDNIEVYDDSTAGFLPRVAIDGPTYVETYDSVAYSAILLQGDTTGLVYIWHSALLDSTWTTSDSVITIVYPGEGTETVSVTVTNAYGSDAASHTLTVTATCNILIFPFSEGFETGRAIGDGTNGCWKIVNQTEGQGWQRRNGFYISHFGQYCMWGNYPVHGQPTDDWLITPAVTVPATPGDPRMAFHINSLYPFTMQVWASTSGCDSTALFTDSLAVQTDATGTLNTYIVSLLPYAGQTIHLAFRNTKTVHAGQTSANSWYLVFDDVDFYIFDTTSYHRPVVSIDADTVGYTCDGIEVQANVTSGDEAGLSYTWHSSLLDTTFSTSQPIVHLDYTVGGTDTLTVTATNAYGSGSAWCMVNVRQCAVQQVTDRYVSDPAASAAEFYCWKVWQFDSLQATTGTTHGRWTRFRDYHHDQRPSMMSNEHNPYSHYSGILLDMDDWLISPLMELPVNTRPDIATTITLGWNAYSEYTTYHVLVSTTGRHSPADFTDTIATVTKDYNLTGPWETYSVDLSAYAGQTVSIAFHHTGPIPSYQRGVIHMDSLSVTCTFDTTPPTPDTVWRTVTVLCDSTMGTVAGGGLYVDSSTVAVTAIAYEGYHFVTWSDGDTLSVRSILLVSDTILTAYFVQDTLPTPPPDTAWHTVLVTANVAGVCETYGSGVYADSSTVEIGYYMLDTATVGGHWQFLGWNDGPTENFRDIFVISDTAIVALFEWVVDSTEGISEIENSKLKIDIYPNPSHGDVTIKVSELSTLTVIDLTGRTVIPPTPISSSFIIQRSSLPSGTYFVRIVTEKGAFAAKLIME